MALVNRTTTGAAGSRTAISIDREHGTNIVVTGSIPAGGSVYWDYASVWDPTGYAASVFRDALARHGVRVVGRTSTGTTPAQVRPLEDTSRCP